MYTTLLVVTSTQIIVARNQETHINLMMISMEISVISEDAREPYTFPLNFFELSHHKLEKMQQK